MLSSGCDIRECRVLLSEGLRIGERATCPSLGSLDGVAPDSEARHVSSRGGVPTDTRIFQNLNLKAVGRNKFRERIWVLLLILRNRAFAAHNCEESIVIS